MSKGSLYPDAELIAGSEVHAILRCAKQYRADLIVMGMRNRSIVTDRTTQDVAERSRALFWRSHSRATLMARRWCAYSRSETYASEAHFRRLPTVIRARDAEAAHLPL